MKAQRQAEFYVLVLSNSALDAGQWSASRSSLFTPGKGVFVSHLGSKIGLVDLDRRKFLPHAGNNASNARQLNA
jgi:hypothetical protein